WATYLKTLETFSLTQDDIRECLNHYFQHRTEFTVRFVSWEYLENRKNDPHYHAHQLTMQFGMYEYNFKNPVLLEGLAAISFDPLNRAVVEDHLLERENKRYLDAIWQEVNNYLTKDEGDDIFRDVTDILAEEDDLEWFVDGVFSSGSLSVMSGAPKAGKTSL